MLAERVLCLTYVILAQGPLQVPVMCRDDNIRKIDVYVFFFDVVGFVAKYLSTGEEALIRLRRFQCNARRAFEFDRDNSYVATVYDNVWSRVNATEPGLPSLLLNFAGRVMRAAEAEAFDKYFGCITRGIHDYAPDDRMLVGGDSLEDLREQHLDVTSEPHIRAALCEKWRRHPDLPDNCVWVSSEAVVPSTLEEQAGFPNNAFEPYGGAFDLAATPLRNGRPWPFPRQSTFRAIRSL